MASRSPLKNPWLDEWGQPAASAKSPSSKSTKASAPASLPENIWQGGYQIAGTNQAGSSPRASAVQDAFKTSPSGTKYIEYDSLGGNLGGGTGGGGLGGGVNWPSANMIRESFGEVGVQGTQAGLSAMREAFRGGIEDLGGGKYKVGTLVKYPYTGTEKIHGQIFEPGSDFYRSLDELQQYADSIGLKGADSLLGTIRPGEEHKLAQASEAIRGFVSQQEASQRQQQRWQEAFGQAQAGTEQAQQTMRENIARLEEASGSSAAAWEEVKQTADEYVANAAARSQEVSRKLDDMAREVDESIKEGKGIITDLTFAKAHDMQVAAMAAAGQIKAGAREIASRYGKDSAEYARWQESGNMSLANAQSQIHAQYAKIEADLAKTAAEIEADLAKTAGILKATVFGDRAKVLPQMAMYENFADQQRVNTYQAAAQAELLRGQQLADARLSLARMELADQQYLAEWMTKMPEFYVDASGLMSVLADIIAPTAGNTGGFTIPLSSKGGRPSQRQVRGYAGQASGQAPSARMRA